MSTNPLRSALCICMQAVAGDVLVFLPGWDEISTLKQSLESGSSPFRSSFYMVLPLHSQIAPEEQKRVFQVGLPRLDQLTLL